MMVLRVPDIQPLHVFKRDACHCTVCQTRLILFGETHCNGVFVFHEQAMGYLGYISGVWAIIDVCTVVKGANGVPFEN